MQDFNWLFAAGMSQIKSSMFYDNGAFRDKDKE